MRKAGFLIGASVLLAACGSEPGVYDVPLAEAMARLEKADIDGFRAARQCGILIHFAKSGPKRDAITWRVSSSGSTMLTFTVKLTAEGDSTRAEIDVPPDPKGGEMYDGDRFYPRPAVNQPLRPAIRELVDAAMAQRPFDGQGLKNNDDVCDVQRAGLENGHIFGVNDHAGMDSRRSAEADAMEEKQAGSGFDASYGQPMDNTGPVD